MAINISKWSIERPAVGIALFLVLTAMGWLSLTALPVNRFPEMEVPVVTVMLRQQAASPSDLEIQVAQKVEEAFEDIEGLERLDATLGDGSVILNAEFAAHVSPDVALERIQATMTAVRIQLPANLEEPSIALANIRRLAIATYALRSDQLSLPAISRRVDDHIRPALEKVPGVGRIVRVGGSEREIGVWLQQDEMIARGLAPQDVSRALRAVSDNRASGTMKTNGFDQPIRTVSAPMSVEDLDTLAVRTGAGSSDRLSDIARIEDAWSEPSGFATLDADPIVALAIFAEKRANEVETFEQIKSAVQRLDDTETAVQFTLLDENASYISNNFTGTMRTMAEGALCTIAVVFLFLRDRRSTLIAAIALPLAVIPTFLAMEALGFSLNLVSLLGLTLAIGLLVDDTIVEIENVTRHREMGKTIWRAVIDATEEIGGSVIAISLTVVAVFLPLAFVEGLPGRYFREFGLTVAVATLLSLLVARVITPMLAVALLTPGPPGKPRKSGGSHGIYSQLLRLSIGRKTVSLGGKRIHLDMTLVTLALGLLSVAVPFLAVLPTLPRGFIPTEDGTRLAFAIDMADGASVSSMMQKSVEIAGSLKNDPDVQHIYAYRGDLNVGSPNPQAFTVHLMLTAPGERNRTRQQVAADVTRQLAAIADIRSSELGLTGSRQFSLTLLGDQPGRLEQASDNLSSAMAAMPEFRTVTSLSPALRSELQITPDRDLVSELGISLDALSDAVRVATVGDISHELAHIDLQGRRVSVRVRVEAEDDIDISLIEGMPLRTADGNVVPLVAVAEVVAGSGPSEIIRRDGLRRIDITADLQGAVSSGTALSAVMTWIADNPLPKGISLQPAGETLSMQDFFSSFHRAVLLGLAAVFAILLVLFGNPFQPLTILLSLPLALSGGILALALTGNGVTMPVLIGALMLMGIVAKNAILIVDLSGQLIRQGHAPREAVVTAAERRARPVIMTTAAMIAGMVPVSLGFGDGGAFRAPMAIVVIGGLVASTALSLLFVPALFLRVHALQILCTRLVGATPRTSATQPHG
ncbi:efflux RND transporter permease subunit [Ensifer sp. HO-A22]|uniref:Efflux RND transporter permease subunit n=1 Tax=Ensifer oleiphilus TaxID=2742698 RepID=A0A7Y6Q7I7_9HYPH|nr:efflux RND transporter permease subunit [Ensifer oleiphilus]NVD40431.1 efflux RND transporter permease subunit [Ensifer oleiphilus]